MKCGEAYQGILEADLAELESSGGSPLAEHLGSCSRCRALADSVLSGETALARGLLEAVQEPDLDELLRKAALAPSPDSTGRAPSPVRFILDKLPGLGKPRRYPFVLLPVAAAAALAALFLGREPQLPGPVYTPPERVAGLDVEVPEGRSVAVMETDNPDITVLWLF